MIGPHAKGSGPAIGDHVTVTHEASGSVVHGTVRLRPGLGLVVDADGCVVELDREGWHCTQRDTEPLSGSVVIDVDGMAWQRDDLFWFASCDDDPDTGVALWPFLQRDHGPVELVWEPTQ